MTKIVLVVLALLVAGCSVRMSESQRASIAATEAVVSERVKAGQITPAEGQMILAQQREKMDRENRDRIARAQAGGDDGPAVYQQVGPGTVIRY